MGWLLLLLAAALIWYFWPNPQKARDKREVKELLEAAQRNNASAATTPTPSRNASAQPELIGNIQGPGNFEFDVVGESHYQDALESIAGAKDEESKQHECIAELVLDNDNPHDNQAVLVAIDGQKVGHLSRKHAREFRAELQRQEITVKVCRVPALIVGGWKRGSDEGHFGVKLDLPLTG